jgi:hypothetical protein
MRINIRVCDLCGYVRDPREQTGRERAITNLLRREGQTIEPVYVPTLASSCDKHICVNCMVTISSVLTKGNVREKEVSQPTEPSAEAVQGAGAQGKVTAEPECLPETSVSG